MGLLRRVPAARDMVTGESQEGSGCPLFQRHLFTLRRVLGLLSRSSGVASPVAIFATCCSLGCPLNRPPVSDSTLRGSWLRHLRAMALSPEEENVREKNVYLAKLAEQAERSAGAAALRRRRLSLCLHPQATCGGRNLMMRTKTRAATAGQRHHTLALLALT